MLAWVTLNHLWGVSHFDLWISRPYSSQMFLYTMPHTWLWCSMYALPANILSPAVMCWIVSGAQPGVVEPSLYGFCA